MASQAGDQARSSELSGDFEIAGGETSPKWRSVDRSSSSGIGHLAGLTDLDGALVSEDVFDVAYVNATSLRSIVTISGPGIDVPSGRRPSTRRLVGTRIPENSSYSWT
jgi:hypothetical protein